MLLFLLQHRQRLQAISRRKLLGVLGVRWRSPGTCRQASTITASCRWLLSCAFAALPPALSVPAVLRHVVVAGVAPLLLLLAVADLASRLLLRPALRKLGRQATRNCSTMQPCTQAPTHTRAKPTGCV